ncbi:MAG TPA: TetR/AcrR family transcriptional regulator [Dehalococcoidia bacterium]|jgi:AcrR family transcriptional regulator|nr:TetR/AcrR family transcriptional regulator [Dehalococcoidia bacterium]
MVGKTPLVGQEKPRRIDRRQAILDAATDLFAERGFGAVSVQEIADAAATHKTTVLYHFETKEALYEAVLDAALGLLAEGMREFMSGDFQRERVAYLIDQQQTFFAEHQSLARLLARELLDSADTEAYLSRFVEPIYLPALKSLRRSMEKGLIRPVDPALFIHDLHVQLIGYFCHRPLLERLKPGDPFSIDALIERRNHLVDQIFRQLALDDPDAPPAKGGSR